MRGEPILRLGLALGILIALGTALAAKETVGVDLAKARFSKATQECLDCHQGVNPGLVHDWLNSRHTLTTPEDALSRPEPERRISTPDIPEALRQVAVGCYECHSLNPEKHQDNFEHYGHKINVVVTPADCQTCHAVEAREFAESKKAWARDNLGQNPVHQSLLETVTRRWECREGKLLPTNASENARQETCYSCHGAEIKVQGRRKLSTATGEIEVPRLLHWPNQGVGRVNPDGSRGACTTCHPRHSFSLEIARKPHTCAQCHRESDVPAAEVYAESKHGNIYHAKSTDWNWEVVPWQAGRDFITPTCATCHNSLITDANGAVVAPRTHDFGARLWVRLYGLPYAHAQPKQGRTSSLKNPDGLTLPVSLSGEPVAGALIDRPEQDARRSRMIRLCQSCHSQSWAIDFFTKLDQTTAEADQMVLAATRLMQQAWDKGWADRRLLFDEPLEQRWLRQWFFYANSLRLASAMSGPQYATFKNGWFDLVNNLKEMEAWINTRPSPKEKE